jgi:hypothetical protein
MNTDIPDLVTHLDPRSCGMTIQLGEQAAREINDIHRRRVAEMLKRERIAELEEQLATALTPRPLSEAGPEKEGVVRLFVNVAHPQHVRSMHWVGDTHFIDIRLPEPDPRVEYERAVAEAGGAFEAWLQAKGGAA